MAGCNLDRPLYNMGMSFGLEELSADIVQKFRWLFKIKGISAEDDRPNGLFAMPPRSANRPGLSWKEEGFQHLTETIYYPMKPEWKTVNLVLFDVKRCGQGTERCNVVYDWIKNSNSAFGGFYDPKTATVRPVVDGGLKRDATLEILNGCGEVLEQWRFDNCWPQAVDWGELEMDISDVVTIDITLRYDRAYLVCDKFDQLF